MYMFAFISYYRETSTNFDVLNFRKIFTRRLSAKPVNPIVQRPNTIGGIT